MIPKIEFIYSGIYDTFWKSYYELLYKSNKIQKIKQIVDNYPTEKKILNYVQNIRKHWAKYEINILKSISKVTGLRWKDNIKVYVVGMSKQFSRPLTLNINQSKSDFIDTLTHELIHNIQSQNPDAWRKWFSGYLKKQHSSELKVTKNHIFLHAVHKKIYFELFNKKRLNRDIQKSSKNPHYKRAWEIVGKEGYESIIKKFKELTK